MFHIECDTKEEKKAKIKRKFDFRKIIFVMTLVRVKIDFHRKDNKRLFTYNYAKYSGSAFL